MNQSTTMTTADHETIRRWVLERGGTPAMVRRVGQPDEGQLVINFPDDGSDEPIVDISWSDFFQRFEDRGMAMECSSVPLDMEGSQFYRLVPRDQVSRS